MSGLVPLWAAGIQELIWVVVVVLFVIIQIGGQILAKGREAQKRAARGGQPGGPNPPRKADALDDEIGEFLRRVAQRRAAGGPQQAGRGPAEPPPRSPTPKRPRARKPQAAEKPIRAEVVREPSVGDRTEELVKEDLNTAEFNRWPSDLGQEVGHTDARVKEQLHEKFDHQLGALAGIPIEVDLGPGTLQPESAKGQGEPLPPTAAAGLAALLANTQSIRQAILINEILRRPEDRWA